MSEWIPMFVFTLYPVHTGCVLAVSSLQCSDKVAHLICAVIPHVAQESDSGSASLSQMHKEGRGHWFGFLEKKQANDKIENNCLLRTVWSYCMESLWW